MGFLVTDNPSWMRKAACRDVDPDIFFPHTESEKRAAIAICDGCPVKEECGIYADSTRINGYPVTGVWGGRLRR